MQVHQIVPYLNDKHGWMTLSEEYGYQKNPNTKDREILISWKGYRLMKLHGKCKCVVIFNSNFLISTLRTRWIWRRRVVLDHHCYLLIIEERKIRHVRNHLQLIKKDDIYQKGS